MPEPEQERVSETTTVSTGKLDDWLIKTYLLHEGESIEEAKQRLLRNVIKE